MKLKALIELLPAEVLACHDSEAMESEVVTVAAGDLMSDVLARQEVPDVLITHLHNVQVIRTASVFGIKAVILVRPAIMSTGEKLVEVAVDEEIILMATNTSLYESCGKLFGNGIGGTER